MEGIYLRLIDYTSSVLTTYGTYSQEITPVVAGTKLDPDSIQFIKIFSCAGDVEQTLNIGSQSTGAGAGKITFNPFMFSKKTDAITPLLFEKAASGTPFKTAEVFYTDKSNILHIKHTYKLVAIKTLSWSAETSDTGVEETVTFEYGGLVLSVYRYTKDGTIYTLQNGWNRVKMCRIMIRIA